MRLAVTTQEESYCDENGEAVFITKYHFSLHCPHSGLSYIPVDRYLLRLRAQHFAGLRS